jgi:hypothetical protein
VSTNRARILIEFTPFFDAARFVGYGTTGDGRRISTLVTESGAYWHERADSATLVGDSRGGTAFSIPRAIFGPLPLCYRSAWG